MKAISVIPVLYFLVRSNNPDNGVKVSNYIK